MPKCRRCEALQSEVEFLRGLVASETRLKEEKARAEVEYMKAVQAIKPDAQPKYDDISPTVEPSEERGFVFTDLSRLGQGSPSAVLGPNVSFMPRKS